ncbi:MAG: VOC family protein [Gammaproteobacteria bacterium]
MSTSTTMTTTTSAATCGIHHVGLTVPALAAARDFFVDALGFAEVGGVVDYPATFVSDGAVMLTLWQARDDEPRVAFDRHHNIGLHHLALRVADAASLDALGTRLAARGDVVIEFPPQPLGSGGARHMMCRVAGGIRLELTQPA